jgi:hypothetical protein
VIVGVHLPTRPIERVVRSALRASTPVGVVVVAHNTDPAAIRNRLGPLAEDPRVRVIHLADGIRSPANAYNAGIDAARGEYISIIGSDDEFADDALDRWIALADETHADVVVAPVRRDDGRPGTAPRPRPGQVIGLDGDRDRLFERTAPLGLVRRDRFPALRLTNDVARGEDQAYALELWFSGARVAFDPALPPYLEHGDQSDRVTMQPGRAQDDFAFLPAVEATPAFGRMSDEARRAVAAKILRVNVVGAITTYRPGKATAADSAAIRAASVRLHGWAAGVERILARRDRALIAAFSADDGDRVDQLLTERGSPRTAGALIPADPRYVFHRHAPLRSMLAQRRVTRRMVSGIRRSDLS